MSVFRIEKNKNYTVMSNYHLKDKNLSYKAKGLLSFMLSLPENWDYSLKGLACISKEGVKAIRTILKELEENNYLLRERKNKDNGQFCYDYSVYEIPIKNLPHTLKGYTVIGNTLYDTQINTKKIITEQNDKDDKEFNNLNAYHRFTNYLIETKFISDLDLDIDKYNNFFQCLLKEYEYNDLVAVIKYTVNNIISNNFRDESGSEIFDKYQYLKVSIENGLSKTLQNYKDLY